MIDVVFLLLVFFMLASRFGVDAALQMPLAAAGGNYTGPPRLIDVAPDHLRLNGLPVTNLPSAVSALVQTRDDMLILRAQSGASLQRIVTVTEELRAAGFTTIVLVE